MLEPMVSYAKSCVATMLALVVSLSSHKAPLREPHPLRIKVRVAISSHPGNIAYLQLDLAKALHYFEDEGLEPVFIYRDGGPNVAGALESGIADFSGNSIDHAVRMRNAARPLKMVASFTNLPAVTLVVRRSLRSQMRSVKDLRGRRIGIAVLGSGTHVIAASVLKSVGIPLHAVTFVAVGQGNTMFAALKAGTIDAAISTDPAAIQMLVNGDASLLLDLVTFDETQRVFTGRYQFTGLMTRNDVILNHPELVQRMVNVVLRAERYISTHSATDIAGALPSSAENDRFVFVRSIEHTRPSFSEDGVVTTEAVANNILSQKALGLLPPAERLDPATFFDMRFIRSGRH